MRLLLMALALTGCRLERVLGPVRQYTVTTLIRYTSQPVAFPRAVGTDPMVLPVLACYVAWGDGLWLQPVPPTVCGLQFNLGSWTGMMFNAPLGQTAAFTVSY